MSKKLGVIIEQASFISSRYTSSAPEIHAELTGLPQKIADFTTYLPVIGIFSAGKSALLNMWLGEKFLPEDQAPTTALATEIHYAPTTSMTVFLKDGTSRRVETLPSTAAEANDPLIAEGLYATCTCNSSRLATLNGIVPVDMPGTDSGIKRHTDAFYRYANKGLAFILVLSCETGNVPSSLAAVVSELTMQHATIILVISKCDKCVQATQNAVQNKILEDLALLGCSPVQTICTSRGNATALQLLQDAITGLDIAAMLDARFAPDAVSACLHLKEHILTLREGCQLNTIDLEEKLRAYARASTSMEEEFSRARKRLSSTLRQNTLNKLDADMQQALSQHLDELGESLMQDKEAFQLRLTAIVNQVCQTSLKMSLNASFEDILAGLHIECDDINSEQISKSIKDAVKTAEAVLKSLQTIAQAGKFYKIITVALAVTTSVIAPVVELLIIFLPDIISLFINPEERKREAVHNALTQKLFPKLRNRVRASVQGILPELEQELVGKLEDEWKSRIAENTAALEACKREKEARECDWNKQRALYEDDLGALKTSLSELKELCK